MTCENEWMVGKKNGRKRMKNEGDDKTWNEKCEQKVGNEWEEEKGENEKKKSIEK